MFQFRKMSAKETLTCDLRQIRLSLALGFLPALQPVLKGFRHHGAGDSVDLFTILPLLQFFLKEHLDPAFKDTGRCWNVPPQRRHASLASMSASALSVIPEWSFAHFRVTFFPHWSLSRAVMPPSKQL